MPRPPSQISGAQVPNPREDRLNTMTSTTTLYTPTAATPMSSHWRDFLALAKPGVVRLVVFTGLCGMLAAPGSINPVLGFAAILSIALAAGGAAAFNQWYEADLDARMKRTARRPIPAGRVAPKDARDFAALLCGASVLVSFVLGSAIGIWASRNDKVSAFIRPINDTLQSMPLFVFLIPVLMFFRVGEFTAFLAIIAYSIVPAIRYTEHGLRNVRPDIVEAAKALGCTDGQLLRQVKLPLALPEIMLGLNQTIMFGLAMLVIASLVGTRGLGHR